MGILGVRKASLAELEALAGFSAGQRRIGYTAAEAMRLVGAMRSLLTRPRKGRAGAGEP